MKLRLTYHEAHLPPDEPLVIEADDVQVVDIRMIASDVRYSFVTIERVPQDGVDARPTQQPKPRQRRTAG
jgi:hypothetical protein